MKNLDLASLRKKLHENALEIAMKIIMNAEECFVVEGVSTHFAGAESVNNFLLIQNQI